MQKSICRYILKGFFIFIFVIHFYARILQWGEDRRFDEMRDNLGKLAFFWMFQVYSVCLQVYILIVIQLTDSYTQSLTLFIGSMGVGCELASDSC